MKLIKRNNVWYVTHTINGRRLRKALGTSNKGLAERRARLKAELDAYYAKLYGLTDEELRYILDPKDVFGDDYPGETFRVLKDKEIRKFGEYRTKRLILEAWENLNRALETPTELAR